MGLYDRDYYREERRSWFGSSYRSMVTDLILVNVFIFVADVLSGGAISEFLAVRSDLPLHPWNAWQLLTAGFVHDHTNVFHVGLNMFVLWLFGRDVEGVYGRLEFLRVYLCLVVLSSLTWVLAQFAVHGPSDASMIGASGAVTGVMIIYILHFPRRLFYVWGVFPIPAWLLGTLYVLQDALGFADSHAVGGGVAYEAHLSGALFGFIYYQSGINLGRYLPSWRLPRLGTRPRLRVHDPQADTTRAQSLDQRVDALLDKVGREGIDSLSTEERRLLEDASRRYQRRRS